MNKEPIKKVIATISEIYCEPEYAYIAVCPYCSAKVSDEVFEENSTIKVKCTFCAKDFKVKIPKFH